MKKLYCWLIVLGLFVPSLVAAADDVPRDTYAVGVSAYFAKDYALAEKLLSRLVESGTEDPRVYYYRGLAKAAAGNVEKAKADYQAGAELEAAGRGRVDIDRALEKVQGADRLVIQQHRNAAKQTAAKALGGYRKAKALTKELAEAIESYQAGRHQAAKDALTELATELPYDPRVFYYRGLAEFSLGHQDAAKADFDRGVKLETSSGNRVDMDKSLLKVQGPARDALEAHRRDAIAAVKLARRAREKELVAQLMAKNTRPIAPGIPAEEPMPSVTPEPTTDNTDAKPEPKVVAKVTPAKPANADPTVPPEPPAAPSKSAINFAYLPADAEALIHVRVKEVWNAPLLAPLKLMPQATAGLAKMKEQVGFSIGDVESVTFATNAAQSSIAEAAGNPGMPPMPPPFVVVVRTSVDLDAAKLEADESFEKVEENGKTYFKTKEGDFAVYIAEARAYVGGSEAFVKAALDMPAEADPNPNFAFVDASKPIVIAGSPADLEGIKAAIPEEVGLGIPALDELAKAVKGSDLKGAALAIGLTKGVQLEVRIAVSTEEQAQAIGKPLGDLVDFGKQTFELAKPTLPPPVASLADKILKTVKSATSGESALLSIEVSDAVIQEAVLAAPALMQLAPPGLPIPGLPANEQ